MASPQEKFNAAYQRTRETEKELKEPNSNPSYPTGSHECTQVWPSRELGSQQTPSLAYNGSHGHVKRGKHAGGIWASFVRGCPAR